MSHAVESRLQFSVNLLHQITLHPSTVLRAGAMEAAICGRVPISPYHFLNPTRPGDKYYFHKPCRNRSILMLSVAALGRGGGLLDKPTIEKTTPGRESEFDVRKSRKIAPPYQVLLHNDNYNKREYVVQVLMKVIPGMTVDNAVNIMQEAHHNGMSVVIVCAQVDAEDHCMQLRGNGLQSSIEPASDGC
ncbi:ATP-dependent Clp protease adapter protein CLPS1, chloroplastic, partial [Cucurbita argyrosperma subsp. sororia]